MPIQQNQLDPNIQLGGGGGGGGSALDLIERDELDLIEIQDPNIINDDFNDQEKGTKTNTVQALSVLQLSTGFNTGTYERILETSTIVGAGEGHIVESLQAFAPKNSGLSGNAWTLSGDLTGYFNTTIPVILCKKITSDGKTVHVALRENLNADLIAKLVPSSVVYNSGPNETVVTLANPETLTLNFGLSASEYAEKIRLIPMGHEIQSKSKASSAYETMDLVDLHGLRSVSIPGQAAFIESINFTGTVIHHDVKFSPNGTYAIARVIERVSPADQWRFYGSSNKGITWTLLGVKQASTTNFSEEIGMETYRIHQNQVVVADNGKWFTAYQIFNGSTYDQKGLYGDLTISSFVDSAPQLTGAIGTIGAGNICVTGSDDSRTIVTGDLVDLSHVAVMAHISGGACYFIMYSGAGSSHIRTMQFSVDSGNEAGRIIMTGAAGSRRIWWMAQITAPSTPGSYLGYMTETDSYANFFNASGAAGYNAIGNYNLLDIAVHNNKLVIVKELGGSIPTFQYVGNATTGTPTGLSAEYQLGNLALDRYMGTPNNTVANFLKQSYNRIFLNTDRLVYALDYVHGDGVRRTHVHEVRDITSYQGAHISQNSGNYNQQLGHANTTAKLCQTFLASSSRVRSISLRAMQVGIIPEGHTLTCEIQTLTNPASASSAPTGTVVATAINTYNPRNITKTTGQIIFFNFNTPALTAGNYYAIVVYSSAPISGTNYTALIAQNTNPYANGIIGIYNSSTLVWDMSSISTGDLQFQVFGDWIYDLSHETRNESQEYKKQIWNQEATLAAIDGSTVRMAHRRTLNDTDVERAKSGHVWSSLISLGSGAAASTYTAPTQIGYQSNSYDKNLVFSMIPGLTSHARIDRTSGVISTTEQAESRHGLSSSGATYSNTPTFVDDSSFFYGKALNLNGTNQSVTYDVFDHQNLNSAYPFCIEAEFKTTNNTLYQVIFNKYFSGASYGWYLQLASDGNTGAVDFGLTNSANAIIGRARSATGVVSNNTYYVVRVTYDGLGGVPRIFLSTTGPNGTFTEVSYTGGIQTPFSGETTSGSSLVVGVLGGGASGFFNGRIGYIKLVKGSSTFAYTGAKDQRAMVGLINTGSKIYAESKGGNSSNADMNQSYDEFGMIDPNGASTSIVDSHDLVLKYSKSLENETGQAIHLKTTMNRVSASDAVNALKAMYFTFRK